MTSLLRLLRTQYTPPSEPTLSFAGKTVLLTGATSGLGYEAAIKLLNLGVKTLIISTRDPHRGHAAKTALEKLTNRPDTVQVWQLEMGSFASVQSFAHRASTDLKRLDVALLNAGVWNRDFALSREGWEGTIQVNALSTALLAVLPDLFSGPKQYGISKLLLEYVMKTVAGLLRDEAGRVSVVVNTVSPGFCVSSLGRQYTRFYERWATWLAWKLFARTTEQGSRSLVTATYQGVESHGRCWRSDGYLDESTALTTGPEGKQLQEKAWEEILDVLEEHCEGLKESIRRW
ncbi:NAD(P)-binding protein [Aspergillus heteromorphus CBS 117.55]|uniref:NAD(P)-binding protein n=1 Tax=Aspergillus heteromorphus CBS 117.55 TaxID=1448321 RepID=A0A317X2H3_9EURO|nr:NAD(P)-binding protein [Aspergillus heteromorphus CBS 117.55]PWY92766.1 NAD(P)-binding protein [Aspergillus heteromorphus CBS 117.55]